MKKSDCHNSMLAEIGAGLFIRAIRRQLAKIITTSASDMLPAVSYIYSVSRTQRTSCTFLMKMYDISLKNKTPRKIARRYRRLWVTGNKVWFRLISISSPLIVTCLSGLCAFCLVCTLINFPSKPKYAYNVEKFDQLFKYFFLLFTHGFVLEHQNLFRTSYVAFRWIKSYFTVVACF